MITLSVIYILLDSELKSSEERHFYFQSTFFPPKKKLGRNATKVKIYYTEKYVAKDIGKTDQYLFDSNKQQGLHPIFDN